MSDLSCPGTSSTCQHHFHVEDPEDPGNDGQTHFNAVSEENKTSALADPGINKEAQEALPVGRSYDKENHWFRRIIRNFTPSYVAAVRIPYVGN